MFRNLKEIPFGSILLFSLFGLISMLSFIYSIALFLVVPLGPPPNASPSDIFLPFAAFLLYSLLGVGVVIGLSKLSKWGWLLAILFSLIGFAGGVLNILFKHDIKAGFILI
ncbi:MAG TPA: hypothetical protein VJL87_01280, partial [Bdellovibrionota bacterium]|nr:hypothetical protein [Bdellovibrionota bacterium]